MNDIRQYNTKQTIGALIAATAIGAVFCSPAFAHGGAGGAGHAGGMAVTHISDAGLKNTNGPASADRDKGLDRATDRMSDRGLAHEHATAVQRGTGHAKAKREAPAKLER